MPKVAVDLGAAERVLPLGEIAAEIVRRAEEE
jgi:chemotaxis response regulator CheB